MLKPKELEKIGSIGLCINHTAKMRGVWSISTSPLCNKYCIKRLGDPRMICAHCYSVNMQKMYKGLKNKLIRNSRILTTRVLPLSKYNVGWGGVYFSFNYGCGNAADINDPVRLRTWVINNWYDIIVRPKHYGEYRKINTGKWEYQRYSEEATV